MERVAVAQAGAGEAGPVVGAQLVAVAPLGALVDVCGKIKDQRSIYKDQRSETHRSRFAGIDRRACSLRGRCTLRLQNK